MNDITIRVSPIYSRANVSQCHPMFNRQSNTSHTCAQAKFQRRMKLPRAAAETLPQIKLLRERGPDYCPSSRTHTPG